MGVAGCIWGAVPWIERVWGGEDEAGVVARWGGWAGEGEGGEAEIGSRV